MRGMDGHRDRIVRVDRKGKWGCISSCDDLPADSLVHRCEGAGKSVQCRAFLALSHLAKASWRELARNARRGMLMLVMIEESRRRILCSWLFLACRPLSAAGNRSRMPVSDGDRPSGPQCCHERLGSQDCHHSLQVIRECMQTHLGSHASECPGDKLRGAHPCLERPKY